MQHVNEIANVTLRGNVVEGVVSAVDPVDGWVSLVLGADGGCERSLVIARPSLVEYTGRKSELELDVVLPEAEPEKLEIRSGKVPTAEEVADAFRGRNVEAKVEDGTVILLNGAVRLERPFTSTGIVTTNETVQGRVAQLLYEMGYSESNPASTYRV